MSFKLMAATQFLQGKRWNLKILLFLPLGTICAEGKDKIYQTQSDS